MKNNMLLFFLILIVSFVVRIQNVYGFVVLNEFLADPPTGIIGDVNRDGVRNSADDEFIEVVNWGNSEISLSQWHINDGVSIRHIFDIGTLLLPYESILIFGGGAPTDFDVQVTTASTGSLSLNNAGDAIQLFNFNDTLIDTISYGVEGGQDQSLNRYPDGIGNFQLHSLIPDAAGAAYSPGKKTNGQPFSRPVVPEPSSFFLFGIGFVGSLLRKGKRKGCERA